MTEPVLHDQAAREAVESRLDANLVVLAGAGAGKTRELVERLANHVRRVGPEVQRLAAITFTRKAAGEMRGRLLLRLRELLAEAAGQERQRLAQALDHLDQCFVGTIHSFCAQLLRERPLEAGLDPEFVELDERQEAVLRRRLWDEFVQDSFTAADPALTGLDELGLRAEDLLPFFVRRCQFGDLPLKPTQVEPPDLTAALAAAEELADQVRAHLPDPLPDRRDAFLLGFEQAELFRQHAHLPEYRRHLGWLQRLHGLKEVTLKCWGAHRDFARRLRDELHPGFSERVTGPVLRQWRQHAYGHGIEFVDRATLRYEERRLALGQLTFQDLLLRATALLRDHPEVRRYFQDRYRALFVDEFQDTDPVQAEMLFYLTGQAEGRPGVGDWRTLVPRPGSLFLVGDEKQSIYRFRRADLDTFRWTRERVVDTGGSALVLDTSFRSLGRLCTWINRAFEPLFAAQDPRYQARFEPLRAYRGDGADSGCVRRLSLAPVPRHRRALIAETEAQRLALFIAAALQGATPLNGEGPDALLGPLARPGDFLVLTRTRKLLPVYARALESLGIPYDLSGGGPLAEVPEVRALIDLLQAVHRPDHPLPLLAFLRGPLAGIGDDELYAFAQAGGTFDYRRPLPSGAPAGLRERFGQAFGCLRAAEQRLLRQSPAAAVQGIVEDLGLVPFAASDDLGSSRAGSLIRLLALVRQLASDGLHWGCIVEELAQLVLEGPGTVEQMTLETGRQDVVRLMNLHQAKGLQARVVFLVDPGDTVAERQAPEFHVSRQGASGFLSLPIRRARGEHHHEIIAEPAGWEEDAAEEARYLQAESLRLLYVAATRACDLLVVSCYEGKPDSGSWAALYPCLAEVPELEAVEAPAARVPAPLPDWETQARQIAAAWEAVRPATAAILPVTEALPERDDEVSGQPGHGRDYGTLVHLLFEAAVNRTLPADEAALVRVLLARAGLPSELAGSASAALAAFRASPLWSECQAAATVYTEVPLAAPAELVPELASSLTASTTSLTGDRPTVLRGQVDLLYRVPGGWKLVDYKTEGTAADAPRHASQLAAYAALWQAITAEPVQSRGIWLTDPGVWVPL